MSDRAGSRRRMDSPASRSDSSPDPGAGSEQDVAAPIPYAYASPSPIGPASSVSEDDLAEWRQKYSLPPSFLLRGSAFIKKWQERYAFVALPVHSYRWNFIAGTHPATPEGEDIVTRARQLPLECR
ncbi:hypothetical protein Bca52824_018215 [Brassica carinata]|uniref:Uncharacterized protein n=1 Tax=Brassica carinata TaxID=52824 RepID=A0A8X7VNH1_BRACI|nr:hypothetical protein Bca52824_018215 [Brassica carinata]